MLIYRLKKLLQRIIPLSLSRADKCSAPLSKVGPTQAFFRPTAANPGNLFAQYYMHQRPVAPDEFRGAALLERGGAFLQGQPGAGSFSFASARMLRDNMAIGSATRGQARATLYSYAFCKE